MAVLRLSVNPIETLVLINHYWTCKTSCGLIRQGLFTNWKFGFDSDPRMHDLKLLVLMLLNFEF